MASEKSERPAGEVENLPQAVAGSEPSAAPGVVRGAAAQLPEGYAELLENVKARVRTAQVRAAVTASRELVEL